jgi:2-oxoglutarate ferredoxin oxidoreductase subunit delta
MSIKKNKIKKIRYIEIDHDLCKSCGICLEMCERDVFEVLHIGQGIEKASGIEVNCAGCGHCKIFCPERAIYVDGGVGYE